MKGSKERSNNRDFKNQPKRKRGKKRSDDNMRQATSNINDKAYKDEGYLTSLGPNVITKGDKDNDSSWYMHLDPIARDYASLPMSQVLGLPTMNWSRKYASSNLLNASDPWTAWGIYVIEFTPTIGQNNGSTAAINVAAQQLYTLIRRNASGTILFDKMMVMMLYMAMDSAYMLYEDLLRAYRVMTTYSSVNRYYPTAMLAAMGFDQSVVDDITKFRGMLDVFAYRLASINIPDQMDIVKRHSWMCSNVYLDNDSNKAQSFIFRPKRLYRWTEGVGDTLTHLTPFQYHGSTLLTLDSISDIIDSVMNPILGSEDIGTISSLIDRAFGENGLIKIKPVEDYATLVPVYSEEVLMQIRNTFCLPGNLTFPPGATGAIEYVTSSTVKGPYLQQKLACIPGADGGRRIGVSPVLNFINEDATPENVMVASRLISLTTNAGSGGVANLLYYGTEIIEDMYMLIYNATQNYTTYTIDQDLYFSSNMSNDNLAGNAIRLWGSSEFRNAPANYLFTASSADPTSGEYYYQGLTADLNNYLYLDDETVKNLHEVAVTSLFTVKDYQSMLF